MYGLVNQAVQSYVEGQWGEGVWRTVVASAQVEDPEFLTLESYPDSVTYAVVAAIALETGDSARTVLEGIGRVFTGYAASRGYADLLLATGGTFPEFVANLDRLHSQVAGTFPNFSPPSFRVTDLQPDALRLHYYSTRDGLAPLIVGLMHGVADRFALTLEIAHVVQRGRDADHDEFLLRFSTRAQGR